MTTNRSRSIIIATLASLIVFGMVLAALALDHERAKVEPSTVPTVVLHQSDDPTSPTVASTTASTIVHPVTDTPVDTTGESPKAAAAVAAPVQTRPASIAFCGPGYDASPSEWSALTRSGITIAYPPCSSYPFGQPVPWPIWDGSVRYMGFQPWDSVPHNTFESYLANATAAGVEVVGFAPELWTAPDTASALVALDAVSHGPNHPVGWAIPEEPSTIEQVTTLVPLATAMHQRGLLVHINFTSTLTGEIAQAAQALQPDLVSSDDYSSIANAAALDTQVQRYFPNTPRLAAVSTVQFDCASSAPSISEREQWVQLFTDRGAAILWFTWDLPQLDQSCQGQNAGTPWTGGLFDAATGTLK